LNKEYAALMNPWSTQYTSDLENMKKGVYSVKKNPPVISSLAYYN
jgi:hypothetical protein